MSNWPEKWKNKTWSTAAGPLTEKSLKRIYAAIPDGDAMCSVIDADGFSDRRMDRAMQLLRDAGLALFDRSTRIWSRT